MIDNRVLVEPEVLQPDIQLTGVLKEQQLAAQSELAMLQEHYADFRVFYHDCSTQLLGFIPSEMQYDMANCIQNAPLLYMVQAQRGEAKTTITGCYGVFKILHNPRFRVLILSAGQDQADNIMVWCTQIITMMPQLAVLADNPEINERKGRRSSEKFDINLLLKGADMTASLVSCGITSNIQGKRADLLIPDDVESGKNSLTELNRERLNHITLDFTSINTKGQIIYLGTPQSVNSVYNNLPGRGYLIDIWPGRLPTIEEELNYGEHLSAYINKLIELYPNERTGYGMDGDRGMPTDPVMLPEEALVRKEVDQGKAYFNLQFMLDTTLLDKDRYPLKPEYLIFYPLSKEHVPGAFQWTNYPQYKVPFVDGQLPKGNYYYPSHVDEELFFYERKIMAIDPAGGGANGDETGYAIIFAANGYFFIMDAGGIPGGLEKTKMLRTLGIAMDWGVTEIITEKNFGYGAYNVALSSVLLEWNVEGKQDPDRPDFIPFVCGIDEVFNTGQKELRIIGGMEAPMGAHRVVCNVDLIQKDVRSVQRYEAINRKSYMLFHQMAFMSRERGALMHDDRIEAVQIGMTHLDQHMQVVAAQKRLEKEQLKLQMWQKDPMSVWAHKHKGTGAIAGNANLNALDRFKSNIIGRSVV